MDLKKLAWKHKTQKVVHGYMPIYENHFRELKDKSINLLEVGVDEGKSLKMWEEYFINGTITGVEKHYKETTATVIKGDVNELETLSQIKALGELDIIIDDASHIASEQLDAFKNLWNMLKDGGYYVVEDLFTLYDKEWNPSNDRNILDEIVSRIKSILVEGDSIQEVHIYGRFDINGIMFLRKRSEPFRIQYINEFNI